jgi:hypothetical protein
MTSYNYWILRLLALACASLILASATRGAIPEAHTRDRWLTSCADAALRRAGAPEALSVRGPLSGTRESRGGMPLRKR